MSMIELMEMQSMIDALSSKITSLSSTLSTVSSKVNSIYSNTSGTKSVVKAIYRGKIKRENFGGHTYGVIDLATPVNPDKCHLTVYGGNLGKWSDSVVSSSFTVDSFTNTHIELGFPGEQGYGVGGYLRNN